jgi:hypothetical protein
MSKYSHFYISDPGHIYPRYIEYLHYKSSINIIQLKVPAYFCLSVGFSKAYYHNSQKQGYTEPISLIGERRARQGHTVQLTVKIL